MPPGGMGPERPGADRICRRAAAAGRAAWREGKHAEGYVPVRLLRVDARPWAAAAAAAALCLRVPRQDSITHAVRRLGAGIGEEEGVVS